MTQQKQHSFIVALLILLFVSIAFNLIQGNYIDSLLDEVKSLEYNQEVLVSHIEDLEAKEELENGNE